MFELYLFFYNSFLLHLESSVQNANEGHLLLKMLFDKHFGSVLFIDRRWFQDIDALKLVRRRIFTNLVKVCFTIYNKL